MTEVPVLRVGLTGGIACGKSTVARMLAELGAHALDADAIVHELLAPGGAAHAPVVERFGREILDAGGWIDRAKLGARVFGDATERAALEALVHPSLRQELAARIAAAADRRSIAVVDAALLVETGAWREYDRVVVVRCSPETQLARLAARPGMTDEAARARIAAQMPVAAKLEVADWVIDTEGSVERTREETRAVWAALVADYEARFGTPPRGARPSSAPL